MRPIAEILKASERNAAKARDYASSHVGRGAYVELARSGGEPEERLRLTADAIANNRARQRDGFYAGGLRAEAGGDYNGLLVDYRLAAIWSRHRWSPAGLDSSVRIHLLPDTT